MKTIYINENIIKKGLLSEIALKSNLPDEYEEISKEGSFPFNHIPSFPDFYEIPFALKLLKDSYKKYKEELLLIKPIDNVSDNDSINKVLSEVSNNILLIEKSNRDLLEKICYNYVVDLFHIPEDTVDFELSLVDSVNNKDSILQLDPEDSYSDFNDIKDAEDFKKQVLQRKIINLLICGASAYYSSNIKSIGSYLSNIDDSLRHLYTAERRINNYLLLSTPNIDITEDNKKISGYVEVKLGNDELLTKIIAKGENLPTLIYETIKGLMELFASHGLPKERSRAYSILKKSDYVKAEIWGMRIGPELWRLFLEACGNIDAELIPYIFMRICSLSSAKFNKIMQEVFAGTKKGKILMKEIIDNINYDSFIEKLGKTKLEKSVIETKYINPEEL